MLRRFKRIILKLFFNLFIKKIEKEKMIFFPLGYIGLKKKRLIDSLLVDYLYKEKNSYSIYKVDKSFIKAYRLSKPFYILDYQVYRITNIYDIHIC